MHVSYRGIPYETNSPVINTTESPQPGFFLGNRFAIQQHNVSQRHGAALLKYRGVSYNA
ncbi:DUF4278 domain-containing protein [Leptolyngbya sp. AN02str]|uniref:DUF4278 domain-containing protein n=1 Tax=Leptolyngbya sp. AN02str TaxID=3423363 RepID=UPI003D30FCA1